MAPADPQSVTPELRAWIIEQARAGCRPQDVLAAMLASGWQEPVAVVALEATLEAHLREAQAAAQEEGAIASEMPKLEVEGGQSEFELLGRRLSVAAALRQPRVVVLEGLLSRDECEQMIDAARSRLARSETVVNATGSSEVNAARTSEGMFFQRGESELCRSIEERIAALLDWPVERGEGLQVLRYGVGAEYKPHYDYFDPGHPGTPVILRRGGQRVATLIMYLNTPQRGGATVFPDVGLEVAPIQGHAVFFSYDRPHPGTRTLHGGAPVLEGEKWIATKWLRQGRFD
ncbi:MAG: 2-oxoglutarate-dependent dioxygenase [Aquabacterium sp.]|nr:MAG: 2-oxoglutarate-dependent dioxygenase [Aquabacterium sp.]